MPNSLKSQITKLRFKDKISINEYEALMSKLAGHDRELKAECVREFAEWLDEKGYLQYVKYTRYEDANGYLINDANVNELEIGEVLKEYEKENKQCVKKEI